MVYSSYNEYVVLNNCGLILSLIILNYIVFTWNIKPLNYILASNVIQTLERILSFLCFLNILRVSRLFVIPYFVKVKASFPRYLFAPGPVTSALRNLLPYLAVDVLLGKDPTKTVKHSTSATDKNPERRQLFLDFSNEFNASKTNTGDYNHDDFIAQKYMLPAIFEEEKRALVLRDLSATASKLAVYANPNDPMISTTVKLRFASCVKTHTDRLRTFWVLKRTPEVIEDLRAAQTLDFRKHWNKFSNRVSSNYYDKMTEELYEKIFKALANSIDHFTTLLAAKNKTIAKCPPAIIGLSSVIPGFNKNSDFSISEVVNFISLETDSNDDKKQYVIDRILDLGRSKKLAGYRYTTKSARMPTDHEIIIHVLKYYLQLKEPSVIPPLLRPDNTEFFKFLLVYFYTTPELNHSKIFN